MIDAHAEKPPKAVSVGSQAFAISDAMVRKIATPALKPHWHIENNRMALGEVAKANPERQQRLMASVVKVPMAVRSRESSSHHLNCGIVGTLMRGGGYIGSVSDPARVNQLIVQRECTSVCWASDSLKFNLMVSADC